MAIFPLEIEATQNKLHVISLWWLCITFVWPRSSKKLPTTAPSTDWNAIWRYFTLLWVEMSSQSLGLKLGVEKSSEDISTLNFSTLNFPTPDFSTPDLGLESLKLRSLGLKSRGLESSWLKSPGLKGLGLKLWVEKSGVEMSFNR